MSFVGEVFELDQGLCAKNTFIDVDSEALATRRRPRTRTAPACELRWLADADPMETATYSESLLSPEVPSGSGHDESSAAATVGPATDDEAAEGAGSLQQRCSSWVADGAGSFKQRCRSWETVGFNAGGDYRIQVRNTFVDLRDDDLTPLMRGPRRKTEPSRVLCELLGCEMDQHPCNRLWDSDDQEEAGIRSEETPGVLSEEMSRIAKGPPPGNFCGRPAACALASQGPLICAVDSSEVHVPVLLPVLKSMVAPAVTCAQFTRPGAAQRPCVGVAVATGRSEAPPEVRGAAPAPPSRPQLQGLEFSEVDGFLRIRWTVDARKLRGSDKQLVSPPFEVGMCRGRIPVRQVADAGRPREGVALFKTMLYPSATLYKGGTSFRKTAGRGHVQLKCVSDNPEGISVRVRFTIGSGSLEQRPRGPFLHSFASSSVLHLAKEQAEWDFLAASDPHTGTCAVSVDIAQAFGA